MEFPALEKEALLLTAAERALLADRLLTSLDAGSSVWREQWITEAKSRFNAFQGGELPAVDGPETIALLRSKFPR